MYFVTKQAFTSPICENQTTSYGNVSIEETKSREMKWGIY